MMSISSFHTYKRTWHDKLIFDKQMEGYDYVNVIFKADPVSDGSFKAAMPLYCCLCFGKCAFVVPTHEEYHVPLMIYRQYFLTEEVGRESLHNWEVTVTYDPQCRNYTLTYFMHQSFTPVWTSFPGLLCFCPWHMLHTESFIFTRRQILEALFHNA